MTVARHARPGRPPAAPEQENAVNPTSDLRTFLGWEAPALPQAAALLADAHARDGTLDLGSVLVALPGGRAARRLKELLVTEATSRGLRLIPPTVTTLGRLPELLYATDRPVAEVQVARRAWLRQLRALPRERLGLLFPHPPAPADLRGWLALAAEVQRLHGTVGGAGRRFADVVACCHEGLLFDDSARWAVLAALQDGYAADLARLGRSDRDLDRIEAVARGVISCAQELWLVGVAELPAVLRAMLTSLPARDAARLRILVHAPAERADAFDALGCVRPAAWLDADIPLSDRQLAIVGHPSNQAAHAARVLAELDGAFAADEIVLGVPDAEVVPYLERQLASAGVRARYAGGLPVERTSAFRLLTALADLLHDGSFESLAALARHPAFGDWLRTHRWQVKHPGAAAFRESDGWLVQLDTFLCERLPLSVTDALDGEGGYGRAVVEALRAALLDDALLGGLRGTRPLAEWMPRVLELLLEIYGDAARSRDVPEERRLVSACQALRNAAAAHARVPASQDETCDVATAMRVLLDDVRGETLPPEADDAAIELLGWLELHLDDAPVAVLTGMNEPFVPEAVNADAFLPNALRAKLGIEDNDRRYARDAYQLTALLHSRQVHAIAGRRTMLGDPLRPSRLLLATSGDALGRRIRAFLGGDDESTRTTAIATSPGNGTRFLLPPARVIRLLEVPDTFSVTELGAVLQDPYGWALGRLMGEEPVEDAARELDPLRFGSLAHRVLERFGRSEAAAWDAEVRIAESLEAALDACVAQDFGATLPAVRLQVEQLRLRLRSFAKAQAAWLADGWRTVGVECRVPDGVPFVVDGVPVRLRGRIDRIDYHAGRDEWAVFDYKTGEKPETPEDKHRTKQGDWVDLQLPLYRELLPHVVDEAGNRIFTGGPQAKLRLGYILLCGDPEEICFAEADWSDAELAQALDTARAVVRAVRLNRFEFDDDEVDRWLSDDLKALLGQGRLVVEEDELDALEVEA
jgi:hypothetical protein